MSVSSFVIQKNLEKKFKIENEGLFFINFTNFETFNFFELKIFFRKRVIFFTKLNNKSLNYLFLKSLNKGVVLRINNKNLDLSCSNLFFFLFNNLFDFFLIVFFFSIKFNNKKQFLYLKINSIFFFFKEINVFLKKYLNFESFKYLTFLEFKKNIYFFVNYILGYYKYFFYKLVYILKIYLFYNLYRQMYNNLFKLN